MADDKNSKKKIIDNYLSGFGGDQDTFIKSQPQKPMEKTAKFDSAPSKPQPTTQKAPVEMPKIEQKKPEAPKVVVPKFIKKDSELEKEITKVIQEVPKEELEKLLKPNKETKEKLLKMDFQSSGDVSEEQKRDFIEQIAKREPEPEVAEMNGALVWKWQKNRRTQARKDL